MNRICGIVECSFCRVLSCSAFLHESFFACCFAMMFFDHAESPVLQLNPSVVVSLNSLRVVELILHDSYRSQVVSR